MNKSSFLNGLLNNEERNIAEYLATWDDLNVFFKTINKSWDFVSNIWRSEKEINENPPSRSAKLRYAIKKENFYDFQTDILDKFNNLIEIENFSKKL